MFSLRKTTRSTFQSPARSLRIAAACAALLVAGHAPSVAAGADSTPRPTTEPAEPQPALDRWLTDLASPDADVRESARVRFMRLKRPALKSIEDLIRRSHPLAPAQAAALRQIVQEIYLAGETYEKDPTHGFLGILMDEAAFGTRDLQQPNDNTRVPGVVVADRIPGFCASRMLRDGDVILGTVEPAETFSSSSDLKNAIGNLEPGSVVRLQVLRQGQVIQISLTLDSRPIEADSSDTAESFRIRRTEKFNEYWQRTFAPLLKESVG